MCLRGTVADMLHCAVLPRAGRRHRSQCCLGRHREHSRRDSADTPLARRPRRTFPDRLAHTGPRGESDTPHSLKKEGSFPIKTENN